MKLNEPLAAIQTSAFPLPQIKQFETSTMNEFS
jgi:hypothetical protein